MVNQVIARGFDYCLTKEAETAAELTPGSLVDMNDDGALVYAGAADETAAVRVLYNRGDIGQTKSTDYAAGENAYYTVPPSGVIVELRVADGEDASTYDETTALVAGADGGVAAAAGDGSEDAAVIGHYFGAGDDGRVFMEVK